ncbi:uroporphyrinogen-III C-methyltransferase [Sandaracinus amylolyticus]|uniref:uroporphyrinogen-III C-methyltransferase n=1 Tax=Sandaracinus amylolyticus TaxID=927083 RepID=A0A0F6W478_9BACT|nr:uroporphyrinogen-III C-methyltransferase [Sandaracinus amylolyticus]AKF06865.1 Uroporphyrinogen-III methyltransferase [Sandaracinus amylolyticus]
MPLGRVYLLGAGPGDPELITQRAARRLGEADLVLYDALVHPELLDLCRDDAEKTFVGKRGGRVSERQSAINERMIDAARAGRVVARLKGGDPYLFGRGSEEAEALHAAGIPFEVVPGVPSPIAATAYAGISLTHRAASSSVAYVTATESPEKDRSSHDWTKLATATETLVIFMGVRALESMMARLIEHGRAPETPAAVIQQASMPKQRTIVGTVATIAQLAREANVGMPALTVVGEVVKLRDALRWYDVQPLFGKRVLVTRPEDRSLGLARLLRDEGAEATCIPAIRIAPPEDPDALARAVREASTYDWLVFTSASGVDAFFDEVDRQQRDARVVGSARLCAIGPATASSLRARGLRADAVPTEFRGEGAAKILLDHHAGDLRGVRVMLPRAAVAREVLPDTLRGAGAHVDVVHAYRNVPPSPDDEAALRAAIEAHELDVITFTAPSTVESVVRILGENAPALLASFTIASIGPVTTAAAEKLGVRVDVTAPYYTSEGLTRALREHFTR